MRRSRRQYLPPLSLVQHQHHQHSETVLPQAHSELLQPPRLLANRLLDKRQLLLLANHHHSDKLVLDNRQLLADNRQLLDMLLVNLRHPQRPRSDSPHPLGYLNQELPDRQL